MISEMSPITARFVGRKVLLQSSINDLGLSSIVGELIQHPESDLKCKFDFEENFLTFTYIKRDEGFCESDGESSVRSEPNKTEAVVNELQVDSDSTSSGTDSSDEGLGTASASPSPPDKFDRRESIPISDVLICHTDIIYKKCVVWVIRNSYILEALVFQASTEEIAKDLYKRYNEASRKIKLERNRKKEQFKKWNLLSRTDSDGLMHLEVKSRSIKDNPNFSRELETLLSKDFKQSKRPAGESLSLRQRTPALLLKKLDEFEENRNNKAKSKTPPPTRKNRSKSPTSKNESKKILVPTKTGLEPVKKCLPKESSVESLARKQHHHLAAALVHQQQRYLTLNPVQFSVSALNNTHHQPQSLPVYNWGAPRYFPHPRPVHLDYEVWGLRGRDRVKIDLEVRRRTQSKSPARTEKISRRFREFGDAVRNRIARKPAPAVIPSESIGGLKSNLKKSDETDDGNGVDKKVHFHKFATVQMVDI